eukprot:jgi/Bigna1/128178/aug1.6_g2886
MPLYSRFALFSEDADSKGHPFSLESEMWKILGIASQPAQIACCSKSRLNPTACCSIQQIHRSSIQNRMGSVPSKAEKSGVTYKELLEEAKLSRFAEAFQSEGINLDDDAGPFLRLNNFKACDPLFKNANLRKGHIMRVNRVWCDRREALGLDGGNDEEKGEGKIEPLSLFPDPQIMANRRPPSPKQLKPSVMINRPPPQIMENRRPRPPSPPQLKPSVMINRLPPQIMVNRRPPSPPQLEPSFSNKPLSGIHVMDNRRPEVMPNKLMPVKKPQPRLVSDNKEIMKNRRPMHPPEVMGRQKGGVVQIPSMDISKRKAQFSPSPTEKVVPTLQFNSRKPTPPMVNRRCPIPTKQLKLTPQEVTASANPNEGKDTNIQTGDNSGENKEKTKDGDSPRSELPPWMMIGRSMTPSKEQEVIMGRWITRDDIPIPSPVVPAVTPTSPDPKGVFLTDLLVMENRPQLNSLPSVDSYPDSDSSPDSSSESLEQPAKTRKSPTEDSWVFASKDDSSETDEIQAAPKPTSTRPDDRKQREAGSNNISAEDRSKGGATQGKEKGLDVTFSVPILSNIRGGVKEGDPGMDWSTSVPLKDSLKAMRLVDDGNAGNSAQTMRTDIGTKEKYRKISKAVRENLRDAWLHQAKCEHASIASFASQTVELMKFGAPANLVNAALVAGQDEVEHYAPLVTINADAAFINPP